MTYRSYQYEKTKPPPRVLASFDLFDLLLNSVYKLRDEVAYIDEYGVLYCLTALSRSGSYTAYAGCSTVAFLEDGRIAICDDAGLPAYLANPREVTGE